MVHPPMSKSSDTNPLKWSGGSNIALKIPQHLFDATEKFYRDVIGLPLAFTERAQSGFIFGEGSTPQTLWLDRSAGTARSDVWLELRTADVEQAKRYLVAHGVTIADYLEPLPPGYRGFWIINPAGLVHLVSLYGE